MKKLNLNVDLLTVESFDTSSGAPFGRGTVRGRDSETGPQEPDTIAATCTCPSNAGSCACGSNVATCQWSCDPNCTAATCGQATCDQTCPNTCYICGPQEPR